MDTCGHCQAQLLEYLYDLLDAPERQQLEEHLAGCPACQAALAHARQEQQLLATAARMAFPAVQFEVPTVQLARSTSSAAGPERAGHRARNRHWGRWVIAAGTLLLLAGLGTRAAWFWRDYTATEQVVRQHQAVVNEASQTINNTPTQLARAAQERTQKEAALQHAARERQLKVVVTGPKTVQPGAPNDYDIQTRNLNEAPVGTRLEVRVRDEDQKVLFEEKDIASRGDYRLGLPPNLPLKPNSKLDLEVVARRDGGPQEEVREELSLAAPVYMTHLATDKPLYQVGETIYFRSLSLDRFSLKPPQENLLVHFTLRKPGGQEVDLGRGITEVVAREGEKTPLPGTDGKPVRGIAAGAYPLPHDDPGGEYVLVVSEEQGRFPTQERKFLVNQYQVHRLNKELEWSQKSYGPGDTAVANCKALRAEGGPVANQPVQATVTIDGKVYDGEGRLNGGPIRAQTDAEGKVQVRFRLPEQIERGAATLSVSFFDGASQEALNKPIPLVLHKLDVEFYPEGGDLVGGVSNRVYFEVRNTLGKPADLRGKIVDDTGHVVKDSVETFTVADQPGANQGRGAFTFTPEVGQKYELKIEQPIGIQGEYRLPEVHADGVALSISTEVTSPGEPFRVVVQSPKANRTLLVGAYCRGRLMDHQPVTVQKGVPATVELKPAQEIGGVYRVTVFEELPGPGEHPHLVPRAERLVYRIPAAQLHLALQPDRPQYIPGEQAKVAVTATDEKGQPTPAVLLAAVVDKSVLTMADEKTARSMPTHFYLTTEVRQPEDLEHADFLLSDHPMARTAVDLLLGTQGWRRFAEQNPNKLREPKSPDMQRLVVTIGQSEKKTDFLADGLQKADEEYQQQVAQLEEQRGEALQRLMAAQSSAAFAQAQQKLKEDDEFLHELRTQTVPLLVAVVLLLGLVGLVIAAIRHAERALPLVLGAGVCALFLFGVLLYQVENEHYRAYSVALNERGMAPPGAAMAPAGPPPAGMGGAGGEAELADGAPLPKVEERKRLEEDALDRPENAEMPAPAPMPAAPPPPAPGGVPALAGAKPGASGFQPPAGQGQAEKADLKKAAAAPRFGLDGVNANGGRALQADADARDKAKAGRELAEGRGGARPVAKDELKQIDRAAGVKEANRQDQARDEVEQMGEELRRRGFGGKGEAAAKRFLREAQAERQLAAPQPFVVREYAHPVQAVTEMRSSTATRDLRSDFTETLYWNPVLVLPDGKAEFSFGLCDSVTTFQVAVMGNTPDGRIGSATANLQSRLPFSLEPKLPIEVNANDRIDVPVSVANNTQQPREVALRLTTDGLSLREGTAREQRLTVPADERRRCVLRLQPSLVEGTARLTLEGETKPFAADSVRRSFAVVPEGFPAGGSRSDLLEGSADYEVELPSTWVKGTLTLRAESYPSTLADLQKGLEGMLREPGGCFEQTSSSNYPNLLILDYLKETEQTKPELEQRARSMLDHGYHILTGYECPYDSQGRHGYEWFGAPNAAHEALTAYGLLEFRDMARVHKVDPAMLERTRQYLLAQRDGHGGFKRNPVAIDSFGRAPQDITNAYIVWALTESGKEDDVSKELNTLAQQASSSKDPYFIALVANSLLNRDRADEAVKLLKAIAAVQKEDGHLDAAKTSITGSGGRDLEIETTALAVLGWLKANRPADFNSAVQKAVRWIGQQRGGYGAFGSTQSTILALKALIAHAKANKKTAEGGTFRLIVGDQTVARNFEAGTQEALTLTLPDAEKYLHPGKNTVRVEMTGGKNVFPCTVSWSYRTLTPLSGEDVPVRLRTQLDRNKAEEGETVHLTVTVENTRPQGQGMAVAIVGLPGGLTLPEDLKQLKQHAELRNHGTERGLISYFEVRGRELILYWRDLAPNQKIEVPVDLICRVPGEYRGPASRAYLYYNADVKHWVEPLQVAIQAKE